MTENTNLHESLTTENFFATSKNQEVHIDDKEPEKALTRKAYVKPTCETIEIEPLEIIAMSGEGNDTEGDYEFGEREEPGFVNERNRGEWGNLWK